MSVLSQLKCVKTDANKELINQLIASYNDMCGSTGDERSTCLDYFIGKLKDLDITNKLKFDILYEATIGYLQEERVEGE